MADRHRVAAEPLLALGHPAVARIREILGEQPQRDLVDPHGGMRQVPLAHQRGDPLLHMGGLPGPRVLVGERGEPADHQLPVGDGLGAQHPGLLLRPPPPQHRLEHRLLGVQRAHTPGKLEVSHAR
jgi:hypothetical protein